MPAGDVAGIIYANLVGVQWQNLGPDRTATTFDLYRRQVNAGTNDLGVPNAAWVKIQTAQPCTIVGFKRDKEGAYEIDKQGQVQYVIEEMHTILTDVQAGDNVIVALDNRAYNVERSSIMGTVTKLVLDHGSAQIHP